MKYVALLRGINVGGHSLIKMADIQAAVERSGFRNVHTVLQSGNIVFETYEKNEGKIEAALEETAKHAFDLNTLIIVKSAKQIKRVIAGVPADWEKRDDIRRYIAFVKAPLLVRDVIKELKPKEGIDFFTSGENVVYLSTLFSGRTKSGLSKIMTNPVYKKISLRNYNTVKKIAVLMGK